MNTAWNRWCRNLPSGTALSLYDNRITTIIITDITGRRNVRIQNPYTCTTSSALPSREEPDISLSIVDSKARLHLSRITRVILAQSAIARSIHVSVILYVGILNASCLVSSPDPPRHAPSENWRRKKGRRVW